MATVRPCAADDIVHVADLFMRVFRRTDQPASPALRDYFAALYLDNPWVDPTRPSLVAVDSFDRVVGFLGAVPMPLRLNGRKLAGVIGGSFMVAPECDDPLAAIRLLRTLLNGSQELAITDTANPTAIRFWERLGGHVAHFQSMSWVLPVRPASLGLDIAARTAPTFGRLAAPVAKVVDRFAARRLRPEEASTAQLHEVPARVFYELLDELGDAGELRFGGTFGEFEWLLDTMRRKTRYGPPQLLALRVGGGDGRGAVIYHPNPGGIGQVAVATARPGDHAALVAALRRHASDQRSAAIMGQADRRLATELRELPCAYLYRHDFVVVHARDAALIEPIRSGDVAMNRLTGEWWTRLQGDVF